MEPIAVIGMGCRFPGGAESPEQLWENLRNGRSGWCEVPEDRWNAEAFYNPNKEARESLCAKSGYFLQQDITAFDARFFSSPPWEAHTMDPQQRILLETTYEAMENAGYPMESLRGSDTSVFVGMYGRDYDRMGYKDLAEVTKAHTTGSGEAIIANRISYLFDLKGASMTIDTGCSGSMVALHQACLTLKAGESRMAIVGGTELLLHPDQSVAMSSVGMVNPDGRCYVFDSRGSGYARGEGVATVILKRLSHALEDNDPIHSVILQSSLNQDGRTAGISFPSSEAQSALMRSVYATADVDPADTLYVEAHGTGTQAGDNAEINSISDVFCIQKRKRDLYVGSVKANIGHLEAASGVAGLIKVVMMLKKNQIPPHIDLVEPKPTLRLEERGIKIAQQPTSLTPIDHTGPRRVSLNSFGYGGTNCHVILEGYDALQPTATPADDISEGWLTTETASAPLLPFPVTAASETALQAICKRLSQWLADTDLSESQLRDLAHTLGSRRSHLSWRRTVLASTIEELQAELAVEKPLVIKAGSSPKLIMAFTGQGAQWYAMGRELLSTSEAFRASIMRSDNILRCSGADWSLLEELLKTEDDSRVGQSQISQPVTTAVQIAIVDLLETWGIRPSYVVGHSSGEIAAAYAAGALDHDAAIQIAYKRGDFSALAKKVNDPGAMMAVGCTEAAIAPKLRALKKGRCKIACVNSPESLTISGDAPAIQELQEMLQDEGIFNRVLKVDTAYHSHHMETIAAEYRQSLQDIPTGKPKSGVTFYSSVTASVKTNGFGAAYWTENLVSKVRFSDALQRLSRDSASISSRDAIHAIVEIGPHSALQGPIRQTLSAENNGIKVTYVPTLVRGQDATRTVLATAGRLFENAWPVDWQAVVCANSLNGGPRTLSNLPAYPWDHDTKYWWESRLSSEHRFRQFPNHDLLGLFDVNSNIYEPRWRYHVNVGEIPWLKHHVVDDAIVFPGAGYICMAIEAIKQLVQLRNPTEETPISRFVVKNATFLKPIMLKDPEDQGVMDPTVEIQLVMTRDTTSESSTWETFRVLSWDRVDRTWNENCKGQIRAEYASRPDEVEGTREEEMSRHERLSLLEHIKASSTEEIEVAKFYKDILAGGNYYGPTFAPFTSIHVGSKGTKFGHGCIEIPNVRKYMPAEFLQPHVIHPSTLDAISHIGVHLFKRECTNSPLMLVYLGEMVVSADIVSAPAEQLQVAVQIRPQGHSFASGDTFAFQRDEPSGDLTLVCSLTNFHMRAIGDSVQDSSQTPFNRRMNYRMAWKEDIDFATNDSFANRPECLENPTEDTAEPGILVDSGLVALVSTLAFKQPRMKILELGVEEASPDRHILKSMHAYGNRMFSEYHYAVPGTLSKKEADTLLGTWKHTVELKTLDLADSTLPQEFEKAHYDLIIASNVTDLSLLFEDAALSRLRRLLNDGGRVFFPGIEGAERKSEFDLALRMNGFTGVEPLTQDSTPSTSILVSRAVGPSKDVQASLNTQWNVQILHDDPNSQHLWDTLASSMSEAGAKCNFSLWNATADIDMETPCIVLDNAAKPLLESPSEAGFEAIKSLLLNSRKLLWISYHQRDDVLNDARKGLVTGMARVARRENAGVSFITLDVRDEIGTQIPDHLMKTIATFASKCLGPNDDRSDTNETEYALSNGRVLIPRVYPDAEFNHWNDLLNHTAPHGECSFQDMLHPLKVVAQTPGLLNSLAFVRDPAPLQELGPDEIQLEAKAYGVNFRDVFIALGQMPDGLPMAGEVAGVVTAVGSEAKSLYKVGDEVVGIGGQPFSSHPRLKALRARKIPAGISLVDASSIPLVYLTAYYGLVELARLESGQTVLIHAASGGVGQAAIQIAKHIGATIFATVGGSEKRALIMEKYGIPESHIFSSRAKSFKQGIMRLTNNRGVDVVLNSLAGEMLTESWECIAPMGTHIEIGKADIYKKSHLSMVPFDKNVTFTSIDLLVLFDERPQKMHTIFGKVLDMLAQGFFSPVFPFKIFAIHQIEQAFRMIAERKHTGKVILEVGDGATVTGELPIPTALRLDPNGTYIVAGGLGDLGRRLCTLLARRGAGNIVTLSRRVLDEEIKSQFSREIAELGATLYTAQCNIVDRLAVEKVKVDLEEKGLSPVRGIIHAGMVLRDHPLENMDIDDYTTSLGPKVAGTANLNLFFASQNLDFFITLSSVSAILGKSGQANYAVGNSFQDAFCRANSDRQREVGGSTRYVSLNLGAIDGSEAITSLPIRQQELMRQGAVLMSFDELFRVLEYSMNSDENAPGSGQMLMGFDRESMTNIQDQQALSNPLFSMVPYTATDFDDNNGPGAKFDPLTEIKKCKSADEAADIIARTMLEKVASFLGLPIEDLSVHTPMKDYALDSLVSIELKNSICRTFQISMQVQDLGNPLGLAGIATGIVDKLKLFHGESGSRQKDTSTPGEEATPVTQEDHMKKHGQRCCKNAPTLARYPLPDLAEEFRMHLESIPHFASDTAELENHQAAVEEFLSNNSEVASIYQKLQVDAEDPTLHRWGEEDLLRLIHLETRTSAQHGCFMATHHDNEAGVRHTQAERAAIIATTAIRHKQALDNDEVGHHEYKGVALCAYLEQDWLYNTSRVPGRDCDEMKRFPDRHHCVVLGNGRFFKLELVNGSGEPFSFGQIHNAFEYMAKEFQGDRASVMPGSLTVDNRDSWAENRETLMKISPENEQFFETVESAAFVICLDDQSVNNSAAAVKGVTLNDGANRWYGKGLQFVVGTDGSSAFIADHAMIDGLTVGTMNEWVHNSIQDHRSLASPTAVAIEDAGVEELHVTMSDDVATKIRDIQTRATKASLQRDYRLHTLSQLGKDFLLERKFPVKGIIDITIQLASRLYYEARGVPQPPAYEEASMNGFHHGRIRPFLTLSPAVNAFCEQATNTNPEPQSVKKLLYTAAQELALNTRLAGCSPALNHIVDVIEDKWPADIPEPALFDDPLWIRMNEFAFESGMTDGMSKDSAFFPLNPEHLFLCYYVEDDAVRVSICGPSSGVADFAECLDEAQRRMQRLITSE